MYLFFYLKITVSNKWEIGEHKNGLKIRRQIDG